MIRRLVLAFALCAPCLLRAQPAPAAPAARELTARTSDVDLATGELRYTGEARLTDGTLLLLADTIRYNQTTGLATATGGIVLTRGDLRLLADRLTYNAATGEFSAENIRLGRHPYFVEGRGATGKADEVTVTQARVSYGEPGLWQPTLIADSLTFASGGGIRSENVIAGIGPVPLLPLPRLRQGTGAPPPLSLALNAGFRRSLGAFVEVAAHAPVARHLGVGADLGLYTNRGVMAGPSGRYEDRRNPDALQGHFRSGFIDDTGDKGTDLYNRPVPEERGYAEWQHRQTLAPNLTLAAQVHWWGDSEVLRDFRPRAFFPVQEPDSFLEAVYTGENYFLSAFARVQPNRFHRVQERLPEIRFDLLPSALSHGIVQRAHASFALLREDPVLAGDPALRSQRLDAYYALVRPITPREWFTFTPVVGGRLTHYARSRQNGVSLDGYQRLLGEVGADAVLRTSATFDYTNPRWRIDGLRHLFTPRLSYRYIPEAAKGRAFIPRIDREVFSTYLQPLGLGDSRRIDDLHATNTLRLAFDNVLQTRDRAEGSRDLVYLNVANDFRFRRRPGERDVSETHVELALLPAHWLQVDLYQSFAPQSLRVRELNAGITVKDGDAWSVRFANNFLRRELEDYLLEGRVRLNERLEAVTRLHYDARRRRFNEQAYGLVQNLGNTWLVSYTVSLYSGRRRESSFGFNVQIETVRF